MSFGLGHVGCRSVDAGSRGTGRTRPRRTVRGNRAQDGRRAFARSSPRASGRPELGQRTGAGAFGDAIANSCTNGPDRIGMHAHRQVDAPSVMSNFALQGLDFGGQLVVRILRARKARVSWAFASMPLGVSR